MAFNPLQSYQTFVDLDGNVHCVQGGVIYDRFGNASSNMPRPINGYAPLTFIPGGWGRVVSKIADYTATVDDGTILVDATDGPVTVTLPTALEAFLNGVGQVLTVKKVDASVNAVTLAAADIDGAGTMQIANQHSIGQVQSSGSAWFILAQT